MPTTYAVVGASRGIGLEYVRQLSKRADTTVFAIVRSKASSTHLTLFASALDNVHIVEGDIVDDASMERAAKEIGQVSGGKLDCLIHNAARMNPDLFSTGFQDYTTVADIDADMLDAFKVNALGVVHSIQAFLPLLRAGSGKKVVVIGSDGALHDFVRRVNYSGGVAYGATKAAAMMIATKYAMQLAPEGFTVVTLTPGRVDTTGTRTASAVPRDRKEQERVAQGMKDADAARMQLESVEQSTTQQLKVIDELTVEDNGKVLSHRGGEA